MQTDATTSAARRGTLRRKSRQRSRVANGSELWAGIDGRSLWARRAGELLEAHIADLGGPTNISEAEHVLVKRAAVLVTELERREAAFAQAGAADDVALATYLTSVNTLRRVLESLGLQRRAKDVTPTLESYLRANAAEAAE